MIRVAIQRGPVRTYHVVTGADLIRLLVALDTLQALARGKAA